MSHANLYIASSIEDSTVPHTARQQSVDVEHFVLDAFGINDARELTRRAHIKPVAGNERTFLVSFSSITSEAQNALLKLFEEPPPGVVFHVVIRQSGVLLPTLRSRLHLVSESLERTDSGVFLQFLKLSHGERMNEIAERAKQKDSSWFEDIARGAELYTKDLQNSEREKIIKSVVFVRAFLGARGASSKMLLEELSLSLPALK